MNHREVMQQALEAMLNFPDDISDEMFESITALKAALAEPEPGSYHGWVTREVLFDNGEPIGHREPTQEPVAKVELMTTGGNAGLATRIVEIDDHLRERLRPGQMLYTHPAALVEQPEPPPEAQTEAEQRSYTFGWFKALEKSRGMQEALQIIAAPQRPDGTWNRDREACRQLAAEALGFHNKGGQDE